MIDRRLAFLGGLNLADDYDARTEAGRNWRDLHMVVEGPSVGALGALFAGTWNRLAEPGHRMRWQRTPPPSSVPAVAAAVRRRRRVAGATPLPALATAKDEAAPEVVTVAVTAASPPGRALVGAAGAASLASPSESLVPSPRAGVPVQIVGNRETRHRSLIRRSFLHAVRRARRSVWIANPYFIPDRAITRALTRAARHGVEVRVLVPARSDVRLCDLAARAVFGRLLRAGVRIAEWRLGMMHAKAAAVDGAWATVGSYNLDRRSLRYNLEVTANVFDRDFARSLEAVLESDYARSSEIVPAEFRRRPLWARLASWLAYQLRAWL
jgi:phosphatidylserine/phosphatidylglycerophosphate/cardiolipin synthase-like enzyme